MIAELLAYKILQLFAMMVIGFLLVKLKVVKSEESNLLSKISLYLLLPAAIINAFGFKLTGEMAGGLLLAFAAAFIINTTFFVIDVLCLRHTSLAPVERASFMYSNAANLIIPIIIFVLGEEWVVYTTAYISVQVVYLWTHAIGLFSSEKKIEIKKIIFNPCIIAIVLGLVMLFTGLELPRFVSDITSSFSDMLGPAAMLTAGMLAAKIDFKSALKKKNVYIASIVRTVVYPIVPLAIVLLLSRVPGANTREVLLISFLASITPVASTIMQFAQVKNSDTDSAVQINIFSTVLSLVTMPAWIALYELVV